MLKQKLEQDLKTALLSGDRQRAMTLRSIKSAIGYAEVAQGARENGLSDEDILTLLSKEAKKRQESADLYTRGGSADRAVAELAEKAIIEEYLPQQLTDEELTALVDRVIAELDVSGPQAMGQVIGRVKQEAGAGADGARVAKIVKERLS